MMGVNHAATGAAAWVAVTSTAIPAFGWYPLPAEAVLLGSAVAAGAALLPDADHHNATIAHSVPVLGGVAAGAVGLVTGGHRKGMHSLLAIAGVVVGMFFLGQLQWQPQGWQIPIQIGSAAAVAATTAFAFKVLGGRRWLTAWVLGALLAGLVALLMPSQLAWLPVCIGVGYAAHIAGDLLTFGGVPLLWPLQPAPPGPIRRAVLFKVMWKPSGRFAVPILGSTGKDPQEHVLGTLAGLYAAWGAIGAVIVLWPWK